jgi:hypothetical protein
MSCVALRHSNSLIMRFSRSLLGCLALLAATTGAWAATAPITNAPPTAPASPAATAPAPAQPASVLDDYLKDLTTALKLSDSEKQEIGGYYLDDGAQLRNMLNDDSLSPLQQARLVSDLRDQRNAKIATLLDDLDRQHEFLQIEARYRVALTELAANGGLVAAAPPAAAPAATPPAPAAGTVPATNAPAAAKSNE